MTIIIHTKDDDFFLPIENTSISYFDPITTSVSFATSSSSNLSVSNQVLPNEMTFNDYDDNTTVNMQEKERKEKFHQLRDKSKVNNRFLPPRNLSSTFLERLLTITPLDYRYSCNLSFFYSRNKNFDVNKN